MKHIKRMKGVTLIELMVIVVIIGILSAIAVPAYTTYIQGGNRTDAYDALDAMVKAQQQFALANNGLYADQANIAAVGGATTQRGYYTLSITNPTGRVTSYALTATAVVGGPMENDTGCTAISINHAQQKTPIACW